MVADYLRIWFILNLMGGGDHALDGYEGKIQNYAVKAEQVGKSTSSAVMLIW